MSKVISLEERRLANADAQFEKRTVISFSDEALDRVRAALARDAEIDQAILKAECLLNEYKRTKGL